MTLNTRACAVFNFHSHPLTIQYSRRASPVAGGQVEINDVADAYDCADLLEFAICHISTLCSHPRRFEGQHLDRGRDAPRLDWRLGRRTTRTGNGAASRLSHSSIVLRNRALSRGGMRRVQCLYVCSTTLHHASTNHAWERPVRDTAVGWTTRARRAPRTGRAQPWAARGGLREATRARQGLARVASVGWILA